MVNPNTRLKRHNSLPPRSSSLNLQVQKLYGFRYNMKSNPYVGSFRHSPPTSFRSMGLTATPSPSCPGLVRALGSLGHQNSPYVGWFRHAPPACPTGPRHPEEVLIQTRKVERLGLVHDKSRKLVIERSFKDGAHSLRLGDISIDGRLRGGAKKSMKVATPKKEHRLLDTVRNSISAERSSATAKILSRLGSLVLFPLTYDSESCGYKNFDDEQQPAADDVLDLFPQIKSAVRGTDGSEGDDDSSTSSISDDDFDDDGGVMCQSSITLSSVGEARSLEPSSPSHISETAEAYHAVQAAREMQQQHRHQQSDNFLGLNDDNHQRLDYMITQMDIARMARNASRHLDVDSILNLPTTSFQAAPQRIEETEAGHSKAQHAPSNAPSDAKSNKEAFSWMMVQENKNNSSLVVEEEDHNICVICLDRFQPGDRLRVLPCDHSFHVGCIDRWLSGSHSHDECFTSGCPTCKRRPSSGDVPVWAFQQLGSALACSATAH